jgi:hypothetical protein
MRNKPLPQRGAEQAVKVQMRGIQVALTRVGAILAGDVSASPRGALEPGRGRREAGQWAAAPWAQDRGPAPLGVEG